MTTNFNNGNILYAADLNNAFAAKMENSNPEFIGSLNANGTVGSAGQVLTSAGGGSPATWAAPNPAVAVHAATSTTTPVDADEFGISDSASSFSLKKLTWANAKATLLSTWKDATGGLVGMTLFKINFKNAANTFTSFFTNTNTAARTYTFQDRDGTIADDTDLALKAPKASPSFTGAVDIVGNLSLAATNRILGTWNANVSGTYIQSNGVDVSTYVPLVPAGTYRTAGLLVHNKSDGLGTALVMDVNSFALNIHSVNYGTGHLPIVIGNSADRMRINTDGTILFNDAGNLPGYKNLIINGSCRVAQRGNVAVVPGTYTYGGADRIKVGVFTFSAFSGTIARYSSSIWVSGNAQQAFVSSSTGVGSIEFTTALEAAATYHLRSRTVTMSCRVYQDSGSNQSFRMGIYKANAVDNFSGLTMIGSLQATQTIFSGVATDISYAVTLGASDANNGLFVLGQFFNVGALSAKSFMIGDFQLVEGSVATPFEMPPYDIELAACRRFARPITRATGQAYSTTQVLTYHDVSGMRATPTLSTTTGWLAVLPGGGGSSATISISDAINSDVKTLTTTSGMTAGHAIGLLPPSGALFLAEL